MRISGLASFTKKILSTSFGLLVMTTLYGQPQKTQRPEAWEVYSGMWIPTGNNDILGNHPIVGLKGGLNTEKMKYLFFMELHPFKAANTYFVKFPNGKLASTNQFLGYHFGLSISRDLFKPYGSVVYAIASVGMDYFKAAKKKLPDYPQNLSITSSAYDVGLGIRTFVTENQSRYVALEVTNEFLNYGNTGGTSLTGNVLNVKVILGGTKKIKKGSERSRSSRYFH